MTRSATVPSDADAAQPGTVLVDGVPVRYWVSGSGDRDLLLVHGKDAHHLWWHLVAPLLEPDWRVTMVDLSGHGDSGHRDSYTTAQWAGELVAVLDAVDARRPVLVGHSMGGAVALTAAAAAPERVAGLVLLDSGFRPPEDQPPAMARPPRTVTLRPPSPTREELLLRFRLMPRQPHPPEEVLAPVAQYSARETDEGWTWKHDRTGLTRISGQALDASLRRLRCPVGYVYGTESVIASRASADHLVDTVSTPVQVASLPGAHHHVILEQPERCAELIDEMAGAALRV